MRNNNKYIIPKLTTIHLPQPLLETISGSDMEGENEFGNNSKRLYIMLQDDTKEEVTENNYFDYNF